MFPLYYHPDKHFLLGIVQPEIPVIHFLYTRHNKKQEQFFWSCSHYSCPPTWIRGWNGSPDGFIDTRPCKKSTIPQYLYVFICT